MAGVIRLKRKNSSGNSGVSISQGEAYYNIADKALYIGNVDNESFTGKKHITQITPKQTSATDKVSFQIGENSSNTYTKQITRVNEANNLTNFQALDKGDNVVAFQWGPAGDTHTYEKTINAESLSGTIDNAKVAEKVSTYIGSRRIADVFDGDTTTVNSAVYAQKATYTDDDSNKSIDTKIGEVKNTTNELEASIQDIIAGNTEVGKAAQAISAKVADSVVEIDGSGSTGTTIAFRIGDASFSHTISGTIAGSTESAQKLTNERFIDGIGFDGTDNIHHYGTCATDGANNVKEIILSCSYNQIRGARISVKFINTNTSTEVVKFIVTDGDNLVKMEKSVTYGGIGIVGLFEANKVYDFIFDGDNYELLNAPSNLKWNTF